MSNVFPSLWLPISNIRASSLCYWCIITLSRKRGVLRIATIKTDTIVQCTCSGRAVTSRIRSNEAKLWTFAHRHSLAIHTPTFRSIYTYYTHSHSHTQYEYIYIIHILLTVAVTLRRIFRDNYYDFIFDKTIHSTAHRIRRRCYQFVSIILLYPAAVWWQPRTEFRNGGYGKHCVRVRVCEWGIIGKPNNCSSNRFSRKTLKLFREIFRPYVNIPAKIENFEICVQTNHTFPEHVMITPG